MRRLHVLRWKPPSNARPWHRAIRDVEATKVHARGEDDGCGIIPKSLQLLFSSLDIHDIIAPHKPASTVVEDLRGFSEA